MRGPATQWRLAEVDGLLVALCPLLEGIEGLRHGFSTRRAASGDGAPRSFDVGGAEPAAGTIERRSRLARAVGLAGRRPIGLRQVHGVRIVCLDAFEPGPGAQPLEADGATLFEGRGCGWVPAVRSADCVPLLLADRAGRAVAAVHAGWRGIAAGIVGHAVEELGRGGVDSCTLRAALGPAVGSCCYAVGPEVRAAVEAALGGDASSALRPLAGDRVALDLHAAARRQLERQGVDPAAVSAAPWCTACHADLFFSHRRDGAGAGRMMALIGWAPRA